MLAATALHFVALGRQSLWHDEFFSVYWASDGNHFTLTHLLDETNPPLYYLLLRWWIGLFGDSATAIRLLSAVFSALTVPVVYLLGRNMFGRQAGVLAVLLSTISYWSLFYAQEARGYALLYLAFALGLLCLNGIVTELKRGDRSRKSVLAAYGLGFVLAAVACAWTHYVSIVVLAALGLTVALIWWRPFAFDRRFLICFAIIGACAAVLLAPTAFLAGAESHDANLSWIGRPTIRETTLTLLGTPEVTEWVGDFQSFRRYSQAAALILWVPLLLYGAWRYRKGARFWLVYAFPVISFGGLLAVSFVSPVLLNRTAMLAFVPLCLGIAAALTAVKFAPLRWLLIGIVLLANVGSAAGYFVYGVNEPWRTRIPAITAGLSDNAVVILGSDTPATAFLYYGRKDVVPLLRRYPANITSSDKLDAEVTGIKPITDAEIIAAIRAGRQILFLSRSCDVPPVIATSSVFFRPQGCAVPDRH
jgi:mannosyltransferase